MKIKLNVYRKRDGSCMIYCNNDRKVCLGVSSDQTVPYYKMTNGQKKLWDALPTYFERAEASEITNDVQPNFTAHTEDKARLCFGEVDADLYITDIAELGGAKVISDGGYLVTNAGKVININQWVDCE